MAEVQSRVAPALHELEGSNLGTAEGLSYLEAKHTLLLQYAAGIGLLLVAQGRRSATS